MGREYCQAIIENVFLLKDKSVVAGCNVISGTISEGDELYYTDGVGRKCFTVKIGGIAVPEKGSVPSITAGEGKPVHAALRIMDHLATELHAGHLIQSEPEQLYDNAPGWEAITGRFQQMYPGQVNTVHFGTYASFKPGERGPLDGVSVYVGKEYLHFVTFGLSELYEKQNGNPERSGYGFELTCKLKKDGMENPALEIRHMCSLLQMVANITAEAGHQFLPGQFFVMGQQRGIDAAGKSKLYGYVTKRDDAGALATSFGKVEFIQLVGVTKEEIDAMKEKRMTVGQVLEHIPGGLTDYKREN